MKRTSLKKLRLLACLGVSIACLGVGRAWGDGFKYVSDGSAFTEETAPAGAVTTYEFKQTNSSSGFQVVSDRTAPDVAQGSGGQSGNPPGGLGDAMGPNRRDGNGDGVGGGNGSGCKFAGKSVEMGCKNFDRLAMDGSSCCCENDSYVTCPNAGGAGGGGAGGGGGALGDSPGQGNSTNDQNGTTPESSGGEIGSDTGRPFGESPDSGSSDSVLRECPPGGCQRPPKKDPPAGNPCSSDEPCCQKPVEKQPAYCPMARLNCSCQS